MVVVQLPPFGTDPALIALMAEAARGAEPSNGILIAAHGSKVSKTSSQTTYAMVNHLKEIGFLSVEAGFIEEAPFLAHVARKMQRAVCLPFFALRASHVVQDIPEALENVGFQGQILPPIGEDPRTAQLIAAALARAVD